jgi:hypothetical protein
LRRLCCVESDRGAQEGLGLCCVDGDVVSRRWHAAAYRVMRDAQEHACVFR